MSVECPACGERISGYEERLCAECEGVLKEDGHIAYLHKRNKEKAQSAEDGGS